MQLELVVCRCGEDLAWTRNVPRQVAVTVYEKTPPPRSAWPNAIPLANVGREAHAWLHHLAERYESLADWTVFAQGHPFDHAPDMHGVLRQLAAGEPVSPEFLWLGFLWETDDARGRPTFVHWSKNPERRELDLEGFFQRLWGTSAPETIRYVGGGQFALSRTAARRRPRIFYERACRLAAEFPDAAHAFERTWDRVFLAPPLDPALFGPSGLRLLKPVRNKISPAGGAGTGPRLPIRAPCPRGPEGWKVSPANGREE